jgi:prevent-host-death family protein
MESIGLAEAKARLSELIARVEAGASINITLRGRSVAVLSGAKTPRKPVDATLLAA